jgi:hypothetical protein
MTSPLTPYLNSLVLFTSEGTVSLVSGRFSKSGSDQYIVKAFMKRQQYSGVSSGSRKIPLESQLGGEMLPGAAGDQFFYRGYSLLWALKSGGGFNLDAPNYTGLTFAQVTSQYDWMFTGQEVKFKFGDDKTMVARTQRTSGVFGGQGIDDIIYSEIGGIQLQLTGTELQN